MDQGRPQEGIVYAPPQAESPVHAEQEPLRKNGGTESGRRNHTFRFFPQVLQ